MPAIDPKPNLGKMPDVEPKSESPTPPPKTLGEALLAFQAEIPKLKLGKDARGQVAGNRSYRYLSLDKLMGEVLPVLNRLGLIWTTRPIALNGDPLLHYRLSVAADLEQGIEGTMPLMLDKENSQGLGSALTYARRYSISSVLGIVPDEDDDGAAASQSSQSSQSSRSRTPPKPPEHVPTEALAVGSEPDVGGGRTLTKEELSLLLDAIESKPEINLDLVLTAEGVDSADQLTVAQGRRIFRRLGLKKLA